MKCLLTYMINDLQHVGIVTYVVNRLLVILLSKCAHMNPVCACFAIQLVLEVMNSHIAISSVQ